MGPFVAPRFFVALPVRMPGTSERRALGERIGEMDASKSVHRSERGGRCQAPSKSSRSTRSTHLRRCLAPTWQPAGGSGSVQGQRLGTASGDRQSGATAVISWDDPGLRPLITDAAIRPGHRLLSLSRPLPTAADR